MSGPGDDEGEMSFHRLFTDRDAESILTGGSAAEFDDLSSFIGAIRQAAAESMPSASATLQAMLTNGFSHDNGDLSATAASNVHGPAEQAAELPKRRNRMPIPQFVAGLSLAGKLALGAGVAAAAAAGGAAATGALPDAIQHAVAHTVNAITPLNLPDPGSKPTIVVPSTPTDDTTFGQHVSDMATSDTGVDGQTVSSQARALHPSCVVPTTAAAPDAPVSTDHPAPAVDPSACKPAAAGDHGAGAPPASTPPASTPHGSVPGSVPPVTTPTSHPGSTPPVTAPPATPPSHPGRP